MNHVGKIQDFVHFDCAQVCRRKLAANIKNDSLELTGVKLEISRHIETLTHLLFARKLLIQLIVCDSFSISYKRLFLPSPRCHIGRLVTTPTRIVSRKRNAIGSKGLAPLYCLAISSKRYVLFNLDEQGQPIIRKASAHGLGHLMVPYGSEEARPSIPAPAVPLSEIGVERWQYDLWF